MSAPEPTAHHHEVVVDGVGFPGPARVRELRRAGLDDVVVVEFTGARWDEEGRTWTVATRDGDVWVGRFLVLTRVLRTPPSVLAEEDGLDIVGRAGRTLRGTWAAHGMVTHLGITVSDFPNLFLLPDHTSAMTIKRRTRYVRQAITTVRHTGMSGLDVRAEVQQRSHAAGRHRTTGPAVTLRSWLATRRFDPEDFELFGRAADAARAEPGDGGRVSRSTAADQALLHDGGDEDAVAPVEPSAREAAPPSGVG